MVGWHHRLDGHEFEQTLGVGDGQGGLACFDSRGHKESDTTERLNLTELTLENSHSLKCPKPSPYIRPQCGRPGCDPWVGKIPWRRERLPTPVFWPGEFHGLYSPWGCKELDKTERLSFSSPYMPSSDANKRKTLGEREAIMTGYHAKHSKEANDCLQI